MAQRHDALGMSRMEGCLELNPREMTLKGQKQGTHCEEWHEEVCKVEVNDWRWRGCGNEVPCLVISSDRNRNEKWSRELEWH